MLQILGLLLLLLGLSINAELKTHPDTLLRPGSVTLLGLTTIFSPDDAPAVTAPGEGRSEVTVDLAFTPTLLHSAPGQELSPTVSSLHLQLIVLEGGDIRELGDGQGIVCCSPEFPECNGRSDSVYVPTALLQRRFVKVQEVDVILREENKELKVNSIPAAGATRTGGSYRIGKDISANTHGSTSARMSPRLSLWDKVYLATTSAISSFFALPTSSPTPITTTSYVTAGTTYPVTRLQVTLGPLLTTGRYALAVAHCDKAALNVLPVPPNTPEPIKPTSSGASNADGAPVVSASVLSNLSATPAAAATFASASTATTAATDNAADTGAAKDTVVAANTPLNTDPETATDISAADDSTPTDTNADTDAASGEDAAAASTTGTSVDLGTDAASTTNTSAGADTGATVDKQPTAERAAEAGSTTAPSSATGASTAPAAGDDAATASLAGEDNRVPGESQETPTSPAAGGDVVPPVAGEGATPSPPTGGESTVPVAGGGAAKPPVEGEGAAAAPGASAGNATPITGDTTTTPGAGDDAEKPIAGENGTLTPASGDPSLLPSMGVSVRGSSAWLNPYGYLPAALYGYLPLYGLLLLGYLLLALLWLVPLAVRRELKLLKIHYVFALVLVAALFDSMLCYWDIYAYNRYGLPQQWISVSCSAARVGHHSLARMLLVALALGYSVYRPSLGQVKHYLFALAAAYALAVGLREYLTKRVGDTSMAPPSATSTLVLGLPPAALLALANIACAFLESLYVTWIYMALRSTVELLEAGNQQLTLRMYQKYIVILSAGVVAAGVYVLYRYVLRRSVWSDVSGPWSPWWMLDIGFWECLYLVMLGSVAVLWRPSKISPRANYRELPLPAGESFQGFEDEDEESLDGMDAMAKGGTSALSKDWRSGSGMGAALGTAALGGAAAVSSAGDSVELLEMGGHDEALGDDLDTDDMVPVSSDEELSEF